MCFKIIHTPILHIFPIFNSHPHTSLLNLITHNQNTTPSPYHNPIPPTSLPLPPTPISHCYIHTHILSHIPPQSHPHPHLSPIPISLIYCIIYIQSYPIQPNPTQSYPYLSNINTHTINPSPPPLLHIYTKSMYIHNFNFNFLTLKNNQKFHITPLKIKLLYFGVSNFAHFFSFADTIHIYFYIHISIKIIVIVNQNHSDNPLFLNRNIFCL